jgi:hypothetical protein
MAQVKIRSGLHPWHSSSTLAVDVDVDVDERGYGFGSPRQNASYREITLVPHTLSMDFQDTLSQVGQRPPKVASMQSRIDAVDITNLPSHASQSQDADIDIDIDNELRLDEVSRRSACDRCRGMKMRCERPHKQYISQLQQCRRCSQANVRCLTTLEEERRGSVDKPSQRSRKRPRQCSTETNGSILVPQALGRRLDEQHHEHKTPSFEHRPERVMTEILGTRSPSIHAFSNLPRPKFAGGS